MPINLPKAALEWEKLVSLKTARGLSRQKAVSEVSKEHAALRRRLIAEANEQKDRR